MFMIRSINIIVLILLISIDGPYSIHQGVTHSYIVESVVSCFCMYRNEVQCDVEKPFDPECDTKPKAGCLDQCIHHNPLPLLIIQQWLIGKSSRFD